MSSLSRLIHYDILDDANLLTQITFPPLLSDVTLSFQLRKIYYGKNYYSREHYKSRLRLENQSMNDLQDNNHFLINIVPHN